MTSTNRTPWKDEYEANDSGAQRAYVRAVSLGIKFAAHGDAWHWYANGTIYSRMYDAWSGLGKGIIETPCPAASEWTTAAAKVVRP